MQGFKAVLPCDEFAKTFLRIGDRFIINLATKDQAYGHFVAISVDEDTFDYFDSYGIVCQNEFLLQTFHQQKPHYKINYSTKIIQGPWSFCCGYFCLLYLIFKQFGVTEDKLYSLFCE